MPCTHEEFNHCSYHYCHNSILISFWQHEYWNWDNSERRHSPGVRMTGTFIHEGAHICENSLNCMLMTCTFLYMYSISIKTQDQTFPSLWSLWFPFLSPTVGFFPHSRQLCNAFPATLTNMPPVPNPIVLSK